MRGINANTTVPTAARQALMVLGANIKIARILQKRTMQDMADRVFVTRGTIARLERGDPTVSMGIYATALFCLGFTEQLRELASPNIFLLCKNLPRRVKRTK